MTADRLPDPPGRVARRSTTTSASATRPRADRRQTTATLAQALGIVALLTTLFVVPAIPLGAIAVVLGVRLRRHLRATGLPTRPADTAIAFGAVAVTIALGLLVHLVRHDAFY